MWGVSFTMAGTECQMKPSYAGRAMRQMSEGCHVNREFSMIRAQPFSVTVFNDANEITRVIVAKRIEMKQQQLNM